MKKSLLATVAAVALVAGAGMAQANDAKQGGMNPGAGHAEMQKGPDAAKGAVELKGHGMKGKAETTGSGAAAETKVEPNAVKPKAEGKADVKGSAKPDAKAEMKADGKAKAETKPSTTGAGASESGKVDTKAETKSGVDTKSSADTKASPAASDSKAEAKSGTTQGAVSLTTEQKTQIRTSVVQSNNAPRVSRSQINFNINVGTVVPRSVHVVTVPETIVRIHPAWRGYSYFIVDDQIVILEPGTLRIVEIIVV